MAAPAKTPVTVFMGAGSGNVSGLDELVFIHTVMRGARSVSIPFCQTVYFGHVLGRDGKEFAALAVTTGVGYVSTTSCTVQLMRHSPYAPTSIVFIGTSGFSPYKGGFDPLDKESGCRSVGASITKNAIGSVCVTSGAFLMESGSCIERLEDNQCSRPNCSVFSKAIALNYIIADASLAEAIRAANTGVEFPPMPKDVTKGMQNWWAANEAAEETNAPNEPHLVHCAEATVNAINVGAERDYLCREYTSQFMKLPMSEAVCVQSMEAMGFLTAMLNFPHVSVAIVRTASNYDMYPLKRVVDGRWEQKVNYVPEDEYAAFVNASFHYSVKTATFVVANYFLSETVGLHL
ncbi:hypothetical protein DQ04_00111150 [Trypanosoma grayi]|uniref:hypothetical protein n=1 Tax=Trypanosoma grayi TaxID=71804 RepID=UPI0004F482C3|nr:hypothetical protein DQ04_00111150 [Trypanosoma grayi]KEG15315.1 hypothetical protein DQ04_00111150 [Trypanosoma grayi]